MVEPACNLLIDSCCDLPLEVIDKPGITLLRFPFIVDGAEYEDDLFQSMTAKEFYDRMRKGADCSTAQIPITVLQEAFEQAAQSGIPTVYLGFSSGLSGTYSTAEIVAAGVREQYPDAELYTVDTHLASIAEGVLIYEAIRQWEKGLTAKELADWAEEARNYVNEQFTLDSLEWLKKGGRIPSSVAFAGSKLDVKPVLEISLDGKLALTGACRGRKKSMRQLIDYYQKRTQDIEEPKHVIIGHADCLKDAEKLQDMLLKVDDSLLISMTSIGPVIGCHVGPGMLALSFMGKDERESRSVTDRIADKVRNRE